MARSGDSRSEEQSDERIRQPFWPVRSTRSGDSKLEEQGDSSNATSAVVTNNLRQPRRTIALATKNGNERIRQPRRQRMATKNSNRNRAPAN